MEILLDEIDWPELGYFSGFMNSTYPNLINVFQFFYTFTIIIEQIEKLYEYISGFGRFFVYANAKFEPVLS